MGAHNTWIEQESGQLGWRGVVVSIHLAATAAAPMEAREAVTAVAGRGIVGDRYFAGEDFSSFTFAPCARSR